MFVFASSGGPAAKPTNIQLTNIGGFVNVQWVIGDNTCNTLIDIVQGGTGYATMNAAPGVNNKTSIQATWPLGTGDTVTIWHRKNGIDSATTVLTV